MFHFSSESVGAGHPDKVADYISDSILDACMAQDPLSRVACETMVKSNCVFLAGEITTQATLNYEAIVRQAIREIGYTHADDVFHADSVFIHNCITRQSPDIAQGVDAAACPGKATSEQGAGDQGIMFGYACNETPELMPMPIMLAHKLAQEVSKRRQSGTPNWLRPDMKTQVAVEYKDGKPTQVLSVVISTQHTDSVSHSTIRDFCIQEVIPAVIPAHLLQPTTQYFINPTGRFVIGGPQGDAGLTGRKIIVDSYGGSARHGGGAFSGKDPSKVDRSAAYMCRWVAKHIVAAGLATHAELQVAYAIGHPEPTSLYLNTFGTHTKPVDHILKAVQSVFSFKPAAIIQALNLLQPIYRQTTLYGHFTKPHLPWEQLTRLEALQHALQSC